MTLLILLAIIEAVLIAVIRHYDNVVLKLLAEAKAAAQAARDAHNG